MAEVDSPSPLSIHSVDKHGVHLASAEDTVVDVLFDGRRIWSFWTVRDTTAGLAPWPKMLRRFLDGTTRLSVVEHVSGRVIHDEEIAFGASTERIAVVDGRGRLLGIDKSNRITTTFDTRDPEQTAPLLDATEQVLGALHDAGVEAFPAYGTLLGAVREQNFIGHDSDVDLAYVSRHTHPLDVIRESYRLQRYLRERGYPIDRYSAAAFKVDVREADGAVRGLDVFGGYFLDGRLYLMGEIGTPFERDWIFPLGTCLFAGRTLPAPANPEKLLAATYGPSWRVPDPAFHFATPRTTSRRLNGWFRGIRIHRNTWDGRYSRRKEKLPAKQPSPLAEYALAQEGVIERLVDVGAGQGGDALWFARRGIPTLALDYSHGSADAVRRAAEKEGLDLEVAWMNLHELRTVMAQGARVARMEHTPTLIANHLIDATDLKGVAELARFARMALSRGGRLYADFDMRLPGQPRVTSEEDPLRPKDVGRVTEILSRSGAVIVHSTQISQLETSRPGEPVGPDRPVARLVAEWQR